ncbi:MAG: prepilin-type N-terminal cleavage/methylation domain-containing protein [Pseudomonadota bacterium]|nr:prepilin-type N-terminal cleavage/methylation domain-containing protein [Pseudomonadota bacterium]
MRHSRGFTLIELMITVAIVAILAAIAVPSYSDYIRRGRLTEGLSALAAQRVKMEQFFQDNRTYVGACQPNTVAPNPATPNFNYVCLPTPAAGAVPSQYLITATGIGPMTNFAYTMDQDNNRLTTSLPPGWIVPNPQCGWVTKKDGSC